MRGEAGTQHKERGFCLHRQLHSRAQPKLLGEAVLSTPHRILPRGASEPLQLARIEQLALRELLLDTLRTKPARRIAARLPR